jgi:ABC-type transport system substrate-binding protein
MSEAMTTPVAAGRILRVGILSAMAKIDPREAVDNVSGMVLGQIFESPYALEAGETTVRPRLLEPLQQRGPLQYAAAVRAGIRFSDGTPLTAGIVARSLNGTKALANKAVVEARGDQVWFTLSVPNPRFDLCLTQGNCAIVLERGSELAGTGPFMFEGRPDERALQNATSIRLVRNPHHGQADGVDELQFLVRPAETDGSPRKLVEALRQGEIDVTTALTMRDLSAHQIAGMTPSLQPGNSTGILFFNTERATLKDASIRRAIALALDVNEIAAASFDRNPLAFVAPTLLPPMMGRSVGVPLKDLVQARRLLEGNTIRLSRLSLLVPWAPRPYMPKPLPVAMLLKKQLGEIGIAVDLHQPKTGEAFFDDLERGNYDLALAGWITDTPDPADFYEALLWSKMTEGENHSNHSRWKNPAADQALMRFREDPTDENKRQIDRLVREEAPLVPLIYGQSLVVHSRKLRNVSVSATGVLSLASVTMQG